MNRSTKSFLGSVGIFLGIITFLLGFPNIYSSVGFWANYVLGVAVAILGIWILNSRS